MTRNVVAMAVVMVAAIALHGCARQGVAGGGSALQRESLQARLAEVVAAYEAEDLSLIESSVDHNMIGHRRFMEGVRADLERYGQIRLTLADTDATVGNGGGVINTRFEKRFVRSSDSAAGLVAGKAMIVFRRSGRDWLITGISGDNPFGPPVGNP